jgi:hypothetical protein
MTDLSIPPVSSDPAWSELRRDAPLADRRELYIRKSMATATRPPGGDGTHIPSADQLTRVCLQTSAETVRGRQLPWHHPCHGPIPKNWPALGGSSFDQRSRRTCAPSTKSSPECVSRVAGVTASKWVHGRDGAAVAAGGEAPADRVAEAEERGREKGIRALCFAGKKSRTGRPSLYVYSESKLHAGDRQGWCTGAPGACDCAVEI